MAGSSLKVLDHVDLHTARQVLRSLHAEGGEVARLVEEKLARMYGPDEVESVAASVFDELDVLEVEDLWERSGKRADGSYVEPTEEAYWMVQEAVQPYVARMEDLLDGGRREEADDCVRGIALALHRFDREGEGKFREWAVDAPGLLLGEVLDAWRKRRRSQEARQRMEAWVDEQLPGWKGF